MLGRVHKCLSVHHQTDQPYTMPVRSKDMQVLQEHSQRIIRGFRSTTMRKLFTGMEVHIRNV